MTNDQFFLSLRDEALKWSYTLDNIIGHVAVGRLLFKVLLFLQQARTSVVKNPFVVTSGVYSNQDCGNGLEQVGRYRVPALLWGTP